MLQIVWKQQQVKEANFTFVEIKKGTLDSDSDSISDLKSQVVDHQLSYLLMPIAPSGV